MKNFGKLPCDGLKREMVSEIGEELAGTKTTKLTVKIRPQVSYWSQEAASLPATSRTVCYLRELHKCKYLCFKTHPSYRFTFRIIILP